MLFKNFFILASLAVLAQAKVNLHSLKQCDGYENAPMQFVGGSSPDEIPIPGQISMDIDSILTEDMPNDMVTKLNLKKLEPFPLDVPCLNGLGSCEYDICAVIEENADSFCPTFPEWQPCHCPLLKGHFQMNGVKLDVPSFGVLDNLMTGAYKATAEFYGKSNSDYKLGCIDFTFTFVKG